MNNSGLIFNVSYTHNICRYKICIRYHLNRGKNEPHSKLIINIDKTEFGFVVATIFFKCCFSLHILSVQRRLMWFSGSSLIIQSDSNRFQLDFRLKFHFRLYTHYQQNPLPGWSFRTQIRSFWYDGTYTRLMIGSSWLHETALNSGSAIKCNEMHKRFSSIAVICERSRAKLHLSK